MDLSRVEVNKVLIVSLTPYFLERDNLWFERHLAKILKARKTQSFFEDNTIFLEKNQSYNLSQFLRKLDETGYEKVQKVSEPGEFSHRGNLIEVFPVNSNYALRFEFFGNKIENIERLAIEIRDEKRAKEILKKKLKSQKLFSDLKGLKSGDYLVHLDHGIAQFSRIEKFQIPNYKLPTKPKFQGCLPGRRWVGQSPKFQNYYVLEYAQGDKLYVPLGLERKLSRYLGFSEPKISRLGSPVWQKTKRKVKEEVEKLAKELLEIYAKREVSLRPPYLPEGELQKSFEATFQFEETPDQIQAIEDISKDLQGEKPMDRIVCGDVGFGKTEVALRTAFKVIDSGKQVVMICPTTILANQHFQNFKKRLQPTQGVCHKQENGRRVGVLPSLSPGHPKNELPIKIEMLSRLQSRKKQQKIIEDLKAGEIDLLVGTHRILSRDVAPLLFEKGGGIGLLIVDDEHRFGVAQKEKLKKLRASLDVLSLSATPIPRTLYLALSALRSLSLIQTPPLARLPVKTYILPFSEKIIKKAIEAEILRGGQVYYLHNRVETIEQVQNFLANLVSKAKLGIAHGRLKEKELIKVMADFQNKKIDVLIATTIIEAGLDFPKVNTLIVADASKLGLSQAYQIRGRIGRSNIQAFAYFFHPKPLSDLAKERLKALKEAKDLGSGYKVALKDLEIRGAGNILGKEQSGNINKVGLNLYCQILSQAVEKLRCRVS